MTRSICDQVAERVALGEPLGTLAEHVAGCEGCRGLVAMSTQLGAVHHAVDPGLGFSARMTVGAQHRLAVRRRRKLAIGLAATVACGAFGVFVVTHTPDEPTHVALPATTQPDHPAPTDPTQPTKASPAASETDDLAALVQLADVDRSSRVSARWSRIHKPLAPYKKLLKGVTP